MIENFYFTGKTGTNWTRHFYVADTQAELLVSSGQPGEIAFAADTGRFFVRSVGGDWIGPQGPRQIEIDFGAIPVSEAEFTIIDAGVTPTSIIVGAVAQVAPSNKDLDELEMDTLGLRFGAGAGQFTIFANGLEGYVADKFKINYNIG